MMRKFYFSGCSTAKTTRTKSAISKGRHVAQTPSNAGFGKVNGLSVITPKFDLTTPLHRTAMRTARADEKFLVSMHGSPVYVPKGKSKPKDNMIPVPLGNGKTLVVPADNPEVQPILQNLIRSCMRIMDQK